MRAKPPAWNIMHVTIGLKHLVNKPAPCGSGGTCVVRRKHKHPTAAAAALWLVRVASGRKELRVHTHGRGLCRE